MLLEAVDEALCGDEEERNADRESAKAQPRKHFLSRGGMRQEHLAGEECEPRARERPHDDDKPTRRAREKERFPKVAY